MGSNAAVAIVDDEKDLVRTYELLFRRRGIPVAFSACDGGSAIDRFRDTEARLGVVIVDFRLPDMGGIDVTKAILALQPDTRIVLISGDDSVREEALAAGARVFLKKPAELKLITETIRALLDG